LIRCVVMFTLFTMTDSKHRILAHACDLYLADGFDGFSMRKLARAVGVTAPALYRHFESKEDVLLEVVGEAHDELFRTLSHALAGPTPEDRFRRAGEAYLDFALANPRYFQMIHSFTEFMGLDDIPEELSRRACSVGQFWHDRVRECIEAGILKPDDPEGIGLVLWAHAYGLISLYIRGLLPMPETAFRQVYTDSFRRVMTGLATREHAEAMNDVHPGVKPR
jgi:AcrR family transcriptional regulator